MAYTTQQLVTAYTNANLGKTPDAATQLTLDAYASQTQTGGISDATALANTLKLVNNTTAVAVETYQFFTGHAPSAAGLSYLVNSTTNANDLNDAYFSKFSAENRFINFSINLATGQGEGAAAFATAYSAVSYEQTVRTAYDKVIGNAVASAAGVDVEATVKFFSRAENITYLTNFVKANTTLTSATDIDLAVKAALIGEILNAATVSGIGGYATATSKLIADLSDGALSTDNAAGVNILTAYPAAPVAGSTSVLTDGIDTIVGTVSNDTIVASQNSVTGALFSSLDKIDGGAGVDTLTITDAFTGTGTFLVPGGATVTGVENVNITTTGDFGTTLDTTSWTDLTALTVISTSQNGSNNFFDVADTTAVKITAATGGVFVDGSSSADLTVAQGYSFQVDGDAVTTASITGSSGGYIDDNGEATLTTVGLKSVNGDVDIYTDTLTSLTVGGTTSNDRTVNIYSSGGDDLALVAHVQGTGQGNSTYFTTINDNDGQYATISIDAVAKAKVAIASSSATTIASTGAGALTLDLTNATAATSFNGASATGGLTLTGLATGVKTVVTGSGADTFTLTTTAKATVDTGAGNDVVTLGANLAAGSTINLGAGNDKLLGTSVIAASTSTAVTVIDGGAGVDTIGSGNINNGNGSQFLNFEILGLTNSGTTLDVALMTGSTITGLELGTGAGTGTYTSLTAAQALTVTGTGSGNLQTLTFGGVSGTADAYSVTFAGTGGATKGAAVDVYANVSVAGIEAITVNSGSASGFVVNHIALADANARTVTLSGSAVANEVDFAAGFGAIGGTGTGVSLIDGSGLSGDTNIDTTNVTAAAAGLTVKTGAGADTINLTLAATVDAGAGADSITLSSAGGTVTTGAGKDIVDVHLALGNKTTITDYAVADKVVFADGAGTESFTTAAVNVSAATTLAQALDVAAAGAPAATNSVITWFTYAGNTYIVQDNTAATTYTAATDIVVKLTGIHDLSTATLGAGATLTF